MAYLRIYGEQLEGNQKKKKKKEYIYSENERS